MTTEEWREVPSSPGYYVSDQGNVRGLRGRILAGAYAVRGGYRMVSVGRDRSKSRLRMVHHLVLEAFVGPKPEGMVTRHLNGDPLDNSLVNLRYGTQAENIRDMIEHGRHGMARKTHCAQGHEFTPENTMQTSRQRRCLECKRREARSYQAAKRAAS